MLFTRCPECETTFRVTDETLKKANGQVRCGRCASVFNAYAELRDPNAKSFDRPEPVSSHQAARKHEPLAGEPEAPPTAPPPPSIPEPPPDTASADAVAATLGARSVADVFVQVAQAATAADAPEEPAASEDVASPSVEIAADAPISAKEVEAVLTTPLVVPAPSTDWAMLDATPEPQRRNRGWSVAAVLAFLVLGTQVVHHFRANLAGNMTVGPWLQLAYAGLGTEVRPRWDVRQYEILDWVATAEPNARGLGSLKITAHIQNRGPLSQPYPAVQLKLKDRWEDAVGSRLFAPAEYLPSDTPHDRMMSPGEIARAEIEVVDPGPDALGFELDVCIAVEASSVSCGTDEVFL